MNTGWFMPCDTCAPREHLPPHSRHGATLVELLIFIAVFSITAFTVLPLLFSAMENRLLQQTMSKVEQNGTLVLQTIGYNLRTSQGILSPLSISSPTTARVVSVEMGSGSLDPTIIGIQSGALILIHRATRQTITASDVTIDNFVIRNTSVAPGQQSFLVSFRISRANPLMQKPVYSRTFQTVFTLPPRAGAAESPCSCAVPYCDAGGTVYHWEICQGGGCQQASTSLNCADPSGNCCTNGTCAAGILESACVTGGGSFRGANSCTVSNCVASNTSSPSVYCCDSLSHQCATNGTAESCASGIYALNQTDCNDSCTVCGDGYKGAAEECDDGNTTAGDGCSADCTIETPSVDTCGDGACSETETCVSCPGDCGDCQTVPVIATYCPATASCIHESQQYLGTGTADQCSQLMCPRPSPDPTPENDVWDCNWACPLTGVGGPFGDGDLSRCIYAYRCACSVGQNQTGSWNVASFLSCYDTCIGQGYGPDTCNQYCSQFPYQYCAPGGSSASSTMSSVFSLPGGSSSSSTMSSTFSIPSGSSSSSTMSSVFSLPGGSSSSSTMSSTFSISSVPAP